MTARTSRTPRTCPWCGIDRIGPNWEEHDPSGRLYLAHFLKGGGMVACDPGPPARPYLGAVAWWQPNLSLDFGGPGPVFMTASHAYAALVARADRLGYVLEPGYTPQGVRTFEIVRTRPPGTSECSHVTVIARIIGRTVPTPALSEVCS